MSTAWMPNGRAASIQQQHQQASPVEEERPERTRNAKAQARHRQKKKKYIEDLELTASKLQIAMGMSAAEVGVLPPPSLRIRELERENARLRREVVELRRALEFEDGAVSGGSPPGGETTSSPHEMTASGRGSPVEYTQYEMRDTKRKKLNMEDLVYLSSNHPSPHGSESGTSRNVSQTSTQNGTSNTTRYGFNPATFSLPTSATPSPTYSTYQTSESQSPIITTSVPHTHSGNYTSSSGGYGLVKMESDDNSSYNCSPQAQFSASPSNFSHGNEGMENWVSPYPDRRIHG